MEYIGEGYDTLIVGGDYEGNSEPIADVLSGLKFDQARDPNMRFMVYVDGGPVDTDRVEIDSPSAAFALRAWYTSKDGRRLFANKVAELSDEGVEWHFDDYEEPSLEDLSKAIAPLLTRGTFELVSVRHCKNGEVQFEGLAVRSDGWARRQSQAVEIVSRENWHKRSIETYEPRKLPANDFRETNSGENTCGQF
jgi:hypothetical protein